MNIVRLKKKKTLRNADAKDVKRDLEWRLARDR